MDSASKLKTLFAGRAASFQLFEVVRDYIQSLGSVKLSVTKTQVAFGTKRKFAWVWLPQMWIEKQPTDSITLTFSLQRQLNDRQIKQVVEPYPNRFTHHVVLTKATDLNRKVKIWLAEAYNQSLE